MDTDKLKVSLRRRIRISRRKAEKLAGDAGSEIDKNLIRRLSQLTHVRRFVFTWIVLAVLLAGGVTAQIITLSGYYQHLVPQSGGVYNEGILGDFSNANPIYATGPVDSAVSRLVFSGLLKYDPNNNLVPDLASSYSVNNIGTVYTVKLKSNLRWQDGVALTAQDVVFTYQVIQTADAQSPLQVSWQGISIHAVDPTTIVFTLPNPLSSFPNSLTTGIIPTHILANTPMSEMRSTTFNTLDPVGSGPFSFKALQAHGDTPETKAVSIELVPNKYYYSGVPKLDEFVVRAYHTNQQMVSNFKKGELNGMSGLSEVPDSLINSKNAQAQNYQLTAEVMVFFKTSSGVLNDVNVRQALVKASDTTAVLSGLGYPATPANEPLLSNQLAYNPSFAQSPFNQASAIQQLTADGWILGPDGMRHKNGQPLQFTLSAADTKEYNFVADTLQKQWRAIGVDLKLNLLDETDLQNTISSHSYDSILYGISIGVDPDVFVYWDSTQFDPRSPARLNLSEYSSAAVDESLEEGRTRIDPALRVIKYKPFLQTWQHDSPALALYQPRFLYITNGKVFGLVPHSINSAADRYSNVQDWEIRETKVTNN